MPGTPSATTDTPLDALVREVRALFNDGWDNPSDLRLRALLAPLVEKDCARVVPKPVRETREQQLRREGKDVGDPANYGVAHPSVEDGEPGVGPGERGAREEQEVQGNPASEVSRRPSADSSAPSALTDSNNEIVSSPEALRIAAIPSSLGYAMTDSERDEFKGLLYETRNHANGYWANATAMGVITKALRLAASRDASAAPLSEDEREMVVRLRDYGSRDYVHAGYWSGKHNEVDVPDVDAGGDCEEAADLIERLAASRPAVSAATIEAAARALWKMGNARIGERAWGSVAAHYIAEATVALEAAQAAHVAAILNGEGA